MQGSTFKADILLAAGMILNGYWMTATHRMESRQVLEIVL